MLRRWFCPERVHYDLHWHVFWWRRMWQVLTSCYPQKYPTLVFFSSRLYDQLYSWSLNLVLMILSSSMLQCKIGEAQVGLLVNSVYYVKWSCLWSCFSDWDFVSYPWFTFQTIPSLVLVQPKHFCNNPSYTHSLKMVVFTGLLAVPAMPRYVRVNTLKISFVEALRSLQEVSHEVHIFFWALAAFALTLTRKGHQPCTRFATACLCFFLCVWLATICFTLKWSSYPFICLLVLGRLSKTISYQICWCYLQAQIYISTLLSCRAHCCCR